MRRSAACQCGRRETTATACRRSCPTPPCQRQHTHPCPNHVLGSVLRAKPSSTQASRPSTSPSRTHTHCLSFFFLYCVVLVPRAGFTPLFPHLLRLLCEHTRCGPYGRFCVGLCCCWPLCELRPLNRRVPKLPPLPPLPVFRLPYACLFLKIRNNVCTTAQRKKSVIRCWGGGVR